MTVDYEDRTDIQQELARLLPALVMAWDFDIVRPDCLKNWTSDRHGQGASDVTALTVHNLLGGELVRAKLAGRHYYWNRFPGGVDFQPTSHYGDPALPVGGGETVTRDEMLADPQTAENGLIARQARYVQRVNQLRGMLSSPVSTTFPPYR
jgi:hypothetical protein